VLFVTSNQVQAARMSSNEQIVGADHSAKRLQVCADLGVEGGRLVGKIQNLDIAQKPH
jgi:hypothetical protein